MKIISFGMAIIGIAAITAGCGGKPQQQARPARTIVFFGDSLTYGYGVNRETESYVSRIDRVMLAGVYENVRTVNAGRSGDTSQDALERIDADIIAHNPDLVIVEFGLNDCQTRSISPDVFRANIETLIRRMPAGADVVLATSPAFLDGGGPEWKELNALLDEYMDVLREISRARQLTLIDVHRAWENQIRSDSRNMESMYLDPSHPSTIGHNFIYNLYMNVLRRKLAD